jgi:hypothetical protein
VAPRTVIRRGWVAVAGGLVCMDVTEADS